jgi:hypothetical protein
MLFIIKCLDSRKYLSILYIFIILIIINKNFVFSSNKIDDEINDNFITSSSYDNDDDNRWKPHQIIDFLAYKSRAYFPFLFSKGYC